MLVAAQRLGFLGPGPVEDHLAHAAGFAEAVEVAVGGVVATTERLWAADLGSGGGVPGLALAWRTPGWRWTLLDASERRTAHLRWAVERLSLGDTVEVVRERAEVAGRDPGLRASLDLVVARSFGPPAVTAECSAPLLRVGGRVVVSEPPGGDGGRWPAGGLAVLGLEGGPVVTGVAGTFQILVQATACGDRFPRRTGMPEKRPLF